jgi:hypothetical protein
MRRIGKATWLVLLIGFGIFFGIDQAAKQQGEAPWKVHPSYWNAAGTGNGAASNTAGTGSEAPTASGVGRAAVQPVPARPTTGEQTTGPVRAGDGSPAAAPSPQTVPVANRGNDGQADQSAAPSGRQGRTAASLGVGAAPSAWG